MNLISVPIPVHQSILFLSIFCINMISVLTGASGRLGGGVLQEISKDNHIPADEIIISASDTKNVSTTFKELGIIIRYGDFAKPQTLLGS
jgi:uncharacterized protein YbjT (DUF2867 family)